MERLRWTSFIVLSTVLGLVIQLLIINSVMAQAQNTSLAQNRSILRIVDLNNRTITTVDPETFQPISVRNLTAAEVANITNVTLAPNTPNTTTNEILTPENTTINETLTTNTGNATTNETLTTNTGNATTNVNLTDKFETLQGK